MQELRLAYNSLSHETKDLSRVRKRHCEFTLSKALSASSKMIARKFLECWCTAITLINGVLSEPCLFLNKSHLFGGELHHSLLFQVLDNIFERIFISVLIKEMGYSC
ncbi:hypothetical protein KIL84_000694 [Mauremys mutica]|uniref:Uncharacterized protein n=1 Tax=Mauremys mutica TaxID=74926 RepID=A0A9D4ATC6_9SAUR|nr:hypothetical protein KIL84_000694 [Mauremys mutica]